MSSSGVIHGRITKGKSTRTRRPPTSNQLIKYVPETQRQIQPSRAKLTKKQAEYDDEIKYFYISRGYTLDQLHEAMEIIFRIGATNKQYGGYVDRAEFKKKATRDEWAKIAPYFYACKELKKDVAVRINGLYTIEPSTVKKEISRQILPVQQAILQRQQPTTF
ncbi:uncharacterized protein DFL_003904 [Arthrobotrys flagrans]|uniref:Uncharacterized protein n=1 Tax=Arthrobotrys flagrans TaxID=97331 RepID=A0A437A359_ARTFL|nr:hypothetical protein DFL_003904 [Arthrobotrys flagrans]